MGIKKKLAGFLMALFGCLFGLTPAYTQDDTGCYVLHEVARVGPVNPNSVAFEGTNEDFTMLFRAEYDGVAASFPNAMWDIDVPAGTAIYSQPMPPGSMEVFFTPPPAAWCAGEEKRFAIRGSVTGLDGLHYRYTPRFNYGTFAEVTTITGLNVFTGEVLTAEFAGDGGLKLLHAGVPDIKIEYLVEGSFGPLVLEYRYIRQEGSPPAAGSSTAQPVLSLGLIEVFIIWIGLLFSGWLFY